MLDGMEPPPPAQPAASHGGPDPARLLGAIAAMVTTAVRDGVTAAPACSLTAPIGPRRRFRSVAMDLADAKAIKERLGGTVNDVLLAVVAGAVRRLLQSRGEQPPPRGLRTMVPVDLRRHGDAGGPGNHVSAFFVPLDVTEPDPVDRYLDVVRAAESHKHGGETAGAAGLIAAAGWTPPLAHALVALPLFGRRLFNLTVTNVRGPDGPVSAFGSPMLEVMPLVPLAADHALGVAIVSYDARIFFGLVGDRDRMPDLGVVADGIGASVAELQHAAGIRRRRRAAATVR
jgi:WS/DGAT/MGAT family acyltransferase